MEEPDRQEESAFDHMKHTVFQQMEIYNTAAIDKLVIQGKKIAIPVNNTNEIPRLKAFMDLQHGKYLEKNYDREQNGKTEELEFNIDPIDEWGKKYYGQTNRQKAVWFVGGIVATVGFMKLYSYCFPKK